MQIYKFGGGVLRDPDGIHRMLEIIRTWILKSGNEDLIIVVSALGKMTNAFEKLWQDWIFNRNLSFSYEQIKTFHIELAGKLFVDKHLSEELLLPVFDKIDIILKSLSPKDHNEAYDQLVSYGEILSSVLISACFEQNGIHNTLIDAREIVCTDSSYREAILNWEETQNRVKEKLFSRNQQDSFQNGDSGNRIWITQGFIGGNTEGRTTTLGREGSDFSAAILAHILNASMVVIWKNVPGVMTADPLEFPTASKLDQISYLEAIELSYFGAKILHPNTIKPLQNKSIPLYVNSIYSPNEEGTLIIDEPFIMDEKPVIIVKSNQVLISIQPRDFSFIMEDALSSIFTVLARHNMKVNLFQHGAISLSICIDFHEERLNSLVGDLIPRFKIRYNSGLDLLTIRHYTAGVIDELTKERQIYVQQQSRKTARFVLS